MMVLCFIRLALFIFFFISLFGIENIYLKIPNISQEEIIETRVGIRPYRISGIRLESESIQDKFIIHNYGYGGSGVTLSFGGAKKVLEILDNQKITSKVVAVLGAGVVGLATAYDLLEKGYEVHIYSNEWIPNLTSCIAAGIWTPLSFPSDISEEKRTLHHQMLKISEERFFKSTSSSPEFVGVKVIPHYRLVNDTDQDAIYKTEQAERIVIHFDNGLIKNGYRIHQLGIDTKLFIEDLFSKIKNKGALLYQKHFLSIEDLLNLKESTLINCMSIGSQQIFDDQEFIPVRGQLIYFKFQEGIDYLLSQAIPNSNYFIIICPWSDKLILGGVYEIGEKIPLVIPKVINKILQNAEKCLSGNI